MCECVLKDEVYRDVGVQEQHESTLEKVMIVGGQGSVRNGMRLVLDGGLKSLKSFDLYYRMPNIFL